MELRGWQKKVNELCIRKGFDWKKEEVDTILLRLHSEISEASEAIRNENLSEFAEELADIFIRLMNCAGVMGVDLELEVEKKMEINKSRPYLHGRARK